jgi:hypothetical protein
VDIGIVLYAVFERNFGTDRIDLTRFFAHDLEPVDVLVARERLQVGVEQFVLEPCSSEKIIGCGVPVDARPDGETVVGRSWRVICA